MDTGWLLLLYSLPTRRNTERVAVWRRHKRMGAVQLTTSTYLLPDRPAQHEQFQWLAAQIRESGGDATLVRAQEIEGMSRQKLMALFNAARDADYRMLMKTARPLLRPKRLDEDVAAAELKRVVRQFHELREIDFFESPRGHEVAMLLQRLNQNPRRGLPRLDRKEFLGKTWQTRPRPEIDRIGSAWLIRKFIDEEAKFIFAPRFSADTEVIPFDIVEAEFSHHGDACTFETLVKRFAIDNKAVRKIGEMIHDADLDDSKFQRVECIGLDRVFKGWGKSAMTDQDILTAGFGCFDGLYDWLQRR